MNFRIANLFIIFTVFCLQRLDAQVNLSLGLVAHYPLDGNTNDVSGNNYNGLGVNGVGFTMNRFGIPNSAGLFDGIDDYIRVTDNGALSTAQNSLVLWFQTESNTLQNLVGKRSFTNSSGSGGSQRQFFINYPPFPGIGSNLVSGNSTCANVATSSYTNTNDWICINRWYMVVVTFDGSLHKIYIDGVLKKSISTSFTSLLTGCNSDLRFGNWWSGDLLPFKGKMDDIRWYNRAINQAEVSALFDNYSSQTIDFNYSQSICAPKTIQFFGNSIGSNNISWSFGDGGVSTSLNPSYTYSNYGTYTIKMISTFANTCKDSVTKVIPIVNQTDNSLISSSDTTICLGQSIQLATAAYSLNSCWSPGGDLSSSNASNPIATPKTNTTFVVNTQVELNNLVVNGDFSNGNNGFVGDYTSLFPNTLEGQFWVGNNPNSWNSNFNSCTDHAGSGNMMMINGSSTVGAKVWSQTVAVTPNTNYAFSTWIQSLATLNPANLLFSINGFQLSGNVVGSTSACQWSRFFTTWNSGSNTSAVLSIVNMNSLANGNDFALDDIAFTRIVFKQDSVRVNVTAIPKIEAGFDTTICSGQSVQLNATGGLTYNWLPSTTLNSAVINNPVASPITSTDYIVSAFNIPGCAGLDTVRINVLPKPTITITGDTLICKGLQVQLNATGGAVYQWFPLTALNASNIANPTASPLSTTTYTVNITGSNGCVSKDSVNITVNVPPILAGSHDTAICKGTAIQLMVSSNLPALFNWEPSASLNNPLIFNPVATPLNNTTYIVTASSAPGCNSTDTVTINVTQPPRIQAGFDTTICSGQSVQLNAIGGLTYNWLPSTTLNSTVINNPVASPITSTDYIVSAYNIPGCAGLDTVRVNVSAKPAISITNDTLVCKGLQVQLNATGGAVYQWFPVTGLNTSNIANPIASPLSPTRYIVNVTGSNGCINQDSVNVSVNIPPVLMGSPDTSTCRGAAVQLIVNSDVPALFNWLPTISLSNSSIFNPTATPLNNTTYIVTASSAPGCNSTDTITVSVLSLPVIGISNDTTVCKNGQAPLIASGGINYVWQPGLSLSNSLISNPIANPLINTKYRVYVTGNNGCVSSDSVTVNVRPKPLFEVQPLTAFICNKDTISLSASGGDSYEWLPATLALTPLNPTTLVIPKSTTIFKVRIKENLCETIDTLSSTVTVYQLPSISISKSNDLDCNYGQANLTASGGVKYNWTPISDLNDPNIANPVATPSKTTTYYLTTTSSQGCKSSDSIKVNVNYDVLGGRYLMPSAFSPNNDGKNDCFGLKKWGSVSNLNFAIFNRWGEKVFSTNNSSDCWDGNFKGIPQQSGTFVYYISGSTMCDKNIAKKGTIVLIR